MEGLNLFEQHTWHPLKAWGFSHCFFAINSDTIIATLIAITLLIILSLIARVSLKNQESLRAFAIERYVRFFVNFVRQSFDAVNPAYVIFVCTFFTYIFICNIVVLIPGVEEPTKDLNTTFALALCSFFYTQKETIKAHGISGWLQEYMKMPFTLYGPSDHHRPLFIVLILVIGRALINLITGLVTLPLELLGKVASVISLSFRLFGNIFGGAMISGLWHQAIKGSLLGQLAGLVINIPIALFFGLFEGFIQAFVFAILSLTYLAMAVKHPHDELSEHA